MVFRERERLIFLRSRLLISIEDRLRIFLFLILANFTKNFANSIILYFLQIDEYPCDWKRVFPLPLILKIYGDHQNHDKVSIYSKAHFQLVYPMPRTYIVSWVGPLTRDSVDSLGYYCGYADRRIIPKKKNPFIIFPLNLNLPTILFQYFLYIYRIREVSLKWANINFANILPEERNNVYTERARVQRENY